MKIKRNLFGRIKSITCDRCGITEKPGWDWVLLCHDCFKISPDTIHPKDFRKIYDWSNSTEKEYKYPCELCGNIVGLPESFYICCGQCKWNHLDRSHNWYGEKDVDYCNNCRGVVVNRKDDQGKTIRTYYQVGSNKATDTPYRCESKNYGSGESFKEEEWKKDYQALVKVQNQCQHDYIQVYSDVRSPKEAARMEDEVWSSPPFRALLAAEGNFDIESMYVVEGSTHFWCWKCGFYMNLNPSRYSLLPKVGTKARE